MKSNTIYAPLLITVLAVSVFVRVYTYRRAFDSTVKTSRRTTVGYDRKLIGVVNRLEHELAERASFGYTGGKDPMTGTTRHVVKSRDVSGRKASARRASAERTAAKSPAAEDPIRLTAIIFDNEHGRHTAVIMDGERSLSVELGDAVRDRRIIRITDKALYMRDSNAEYRYDVFGNREKRRARSYER
ncbi:MAG: hypothetical protein GF344_14390 [Chitinivibrionales bacterium]|nr:hypothetical protein [Chitinivibrionales bacterium]MBD3357913.1 hypothetical protein [Chitinivibrionales bacterium]